MLANKINKTVKLKGQGRCDLIRVNLCNEKTCTGKQKSGLKDYFDEMFSSLIWLG
jgi:hypothetical protein